MNDLLLLSNQKSQTQEPTQNLVSDAFLKEDTAKSGQKDPTNKSPTNRDSHTKMALDEDQCIFPENDGQEIGQEEAANNKYIYTNSFSAGDLKLRNTAHDLKGKEPGGKLIAPVHNHSSHLQQKYYVDS